MIDTKLLIDAHSSEYGRLNYINRGGDLAADTVEALEDIPKDIEELSEIIEYALDYNHEERFDELLDVAMYEDNFVDMNKDDLIEMIKKTAGVVKANYVKHIKFVEHMRVMTENCKAYEA